MFYFGDLYTEFAKSPNEKPRRSMYMQMVIDYFVYYHHHLSLSLSLSPPLSFPSLPPPSSQIPSQVQRLLLLVCLLPLEACRIQPKFPRPRVPLSLLQVHLQAAGGRQLLRLS